MICRRITRRAGLPNGGAGYTPARPCETVVPWAYPGVPRLTPQLIFWAAGTIPPRASKALRSCIHGGCGPSGSSLVLQARDASRRRSENPLPAAARTLGAAERCHPARRIAPLARRTCAPSGQTPAPGLLAWQSPRTPRHKPPRPHRQSDTDARVALIASIRKLQRIDHQRIGGRRQRPR
jgi:hypothetical protein